MEKSRKTIKLYVFSIAENDIEIHCDYFRNIFCAAETQNANKIYSI
jgi:hypothetical protein